MRRDRHKGVPVQIHPLAPIGGQKREGCMKMHLINAEWRRSFRPF